MKRGKDYRDIRDTMVFQLYLNDSVVMEYYDIHSPLREDKLSHYYDQYSLNESFSKLKIRKQQWKPTIQHVLSAECYDSHSPF